MDGKPEDPLDLWLYRNRRLHHWCLCPSAVHLRVSLPRNSFPVLHPPFLGMDPFLEEEDIDSISSRVVISRDFSYIPLSYPQFAASLFAANDLCRSSLAAAAILFAHPLFTHLGVGKGVSLLASLTCACVGGIFVLYYFGATLRARSKFAVK